MRSDKYKKKKETIDIEEELNSEEKTPSRISILLKNILITLLIIFIVIFSYAHFIEPSFTSIKEYKIENADIPDSYNGIKIVQFSDIHYGTTFSKNDLKKLVDKINELEPDIIFFTGDLMDRNIGIDNKEQEEIIEILSKLNPSLSKYAIIGDEDNEKIFERFVCRRAHDGCCRL